MNHLATPEFGGCYRRLPPPIRELADKSFELLRNNQDHPSLRFKRIGELWIARVGLRYRAVARTDDNNYVWFWIGPHDEYEELLKTAYA